MDETIKMIEELTDAALGRVERPLVVPEVDRSALDVELRVIDDHGALDTMPDPAGSIPVLKRMVLRIGAFNWMRQRAVNHSVGRAFEAVLAEVDELKASGAQHERRTVSSAAATVASLEELRGSTAPSSEVRSLSARLRDLSNGLDEQRDAIGRLAESIRVDHLGLRDDMSAVRDDADASVRSSRELVDDQSVEIAALRADVIALQTKLIVEQRHTAALRAEIARARIGNPTPEDESDNDLVPPDVAELYDRFEEAFRPSNAELDDRFEEYVDVLAELRDGSFPLIDIGAGRGEFVALLDRRGIPARGIDLSADAVAHATAHGRPVERGEAVSYLRTLDTESVGAVTAFHLVEHLDPATVLALLDEALRVLRPGGILVLETPNPTNLTVGAAAFYHDPTHLRPVTPTYLEFLVQDRGFTDVTTRFLHPSPEFELELTTPDGRGGHATKLLLDDVRWALKGPQDYAVLARRPAES